MTSEESTNVPVTEKSPAPARTRSMSFSDIRDEMDRLWATIVANPWRPLRFAGVQTPLMPTMDVFEKDNQLTVKVELPGIEAKDIDVTVEDGVLTIAGEKKEEREIKEATYHRSERTYGKFSRQFPLPPQAEGEKATAKFAHGVLEITIPMSSSAPPNAKKIEIQAS